MTHRERGADGRWTDSERASLTCERCGASFWRPCQPRDSRRFCGRACGMAHVHDARRARAVAQANACKERDAARAILKMQARMRVCVMCGVAWVMRSGQAVCHKERCRFDKAWANNRRWNPPTPPRTGTCATCGEPWKHQGRGAQRKLCRRCTNRAGSGTSAQRARRAGVVSRSDVDPMKVFARDDWRCQLCGIHTPKRLRGTTESAAPELDHIIPLALGGPHTNDNVQCACRACNHAKGATWRGQVRVPFDTGSVLGR